MNSQWYQLYVRCIRIENSSKNKEEKERMRSVIDLIEKMFLTKKDNR